MNITKCNRIKLGMEKTHANDAFVIAEGKNQIRSSKPYHVIQIRRNNRSLRISRKGKPPSIKRQRYKYSPGDLVKKKVSSLWGEPIDKNDRITIYTVKGVSSYGERIRLANPIPEEKDLDVKIGQMKIYKYGSGLRFHLEKKDNNKIVKKNKVKKLRFLNGFIDSGEHPNVSGCQSKRDLPFCYVLPFFFHKFLNP